MVVTHGWMTSLGLRRRLFVPTLWPLTFSLTNAQASRLRSPSWSSSADVICPSVRYHVIHCICYPETAFDSLEFTTALLLNDIANVVNGRIYVALMAHTICSPLWNFQIAFSCLNLFIATYDCLNYKAFHYFCSYSDVFVGCKMCWLRFLDHWAFMFWS